MKAVFLPIALLCFSINAPSQITKENWIVGGNANFSYLKSANTSSTQFKQTDIQVSPMVGYFFMDKFAFGLRPSLTFGSNNVDNSTTALSVGPFLRYYFLAPEKMFNLLMESGYSYGNLSGEGLDLKQTLHSFSVSGGPVLYFNSSVGLEFIMSYSTTKIINYEGKNNKLSFGVGFQFHLEKDN